MQGIWQRKYGMQWAWYIESWHDYICIEDACYDTGEPFFFYLSSHPTLGAGGACNKFYEFSVQQILRIFWAPNMRRTDLFFNERFHGCSTRGRILGKSCLKIFSCTQRTIERLRRGGKTHRFSRDTTVSWFQNRRFR